MPPVALRRVAWIAAALSVAGRVVGRLARDRDIMRVAFAQARIRNLHELGLLMQFCKGSRAGVAHGGPQAAHELVQDG